MPLYQLFLLALHRKLLPTYIPSPQTTNFSNSTPNTHKLMLCSNPQAVHQNFLFTSCPSSRTIFLNNPHTCFNLAPLHKQNYSERSTTASTQDTQWLLKLSSCLVSPLELDLRFLRIWNYLLSKAISTQEINPALILFYLSHLSFAGFSSLHCHLIIDTHPNTAQSSNLSFYLQLPPSILPSKSLAGHSLKCCLHDISTEHMSPTSTSLFNCTFNFLTSKWISLWHVTLNTAKNKLTMHQLSSFLFFFLC